MIVSIGILAAFFILAIFAISKFAKREIKSGYSSNYLKEIFQYLVLIGLLITVAVGLAGLLGRALNQSTLILADQSALARYSAFVLVGTPILLALALWIRKQHLTSAEQKQSLIWNSYLTIVNFISLITVISSLNQVLRWLFTDDEFSNQSLAVFLVWSVIWLIHFWLSRNFADLERMQLSYLIGSLIALIIGVVAVASLINIALRSTLLTSESRILSNDQDIFINGLIYLFISVIFWTLYWLTISLKSTKSKLWYFYVIVVTAGTSLIVALSTLARVFYEILVWIFGTSDNETFSSHFQNVPTLVGVSLSTLLVWWYHKSVFNQEKTINRTEVNRTYDYLIAGIGLVAATAGFTTVLVSLAESISSSTVITGGGAVNTLFAALTLIAVGGPVWFIHWSRVQKLVQKKDESEIGSAIRRAYLLILFGVSAITAIISTISAAFLIFEDIFVAGVNIDTINRVRYPLAILISTAAIAGYHWPIFKEERKVYKDLYLGPEIIYLISPKDADLKTWLSKNVSARTKVWFDLSSQAPAFDRAELLDLISNSKAREMFIISEAGKAKLIDVTNEAFFK